MSEDVTTFSRRIAEARARVQTCLRRVPESVSADLDETWQELQAAEEDLRQQVTAAREALDAQRHRYQGLLALSPNGYVVTDGAGFIREVNRAAAEMLQMSPALMLGKPLPSLVVPESRHGFRQGIASVAKSRRVHHWEMVLQPPQGPAFSASISVVAAACGAAGVELCWMISDDSQRRRLESQLREA